MPYQPTGRKPGRPSLADLEARRLKEELAKQQAAPAPSASPFAAMPLPEPPEPVQEAPRPEPDRWSAQEDREPPRRQISEADIIRNMTQRNVADLTDDPDILASFNPDNPIPLSRITLPNSELHMTYEERMEERRKTMEAFKRRVGTPGG